MYNMGVGQEERRLALPLTRMLEAPGLTTGTLVTFTTKGASDLKYAFYSASFLHLCVSNFMSGPQL